MEYKKYHLNNYDLYVIPLHKFKTTNVVFEFVKPYEKADDSCLQFLGMLSDHGTLKYPKTSDYEKELIKLYGLDITKENFRVNDNYFYRFGLNIINKEYSSQDNFKNSILFAQDAILNPIVLDTKLSKLYFNETKNTILIGHRNWLSNIQHQVRYRSLKYFMKDNYKTHITTINEYKAVTPEKVCSYYKRLLSQSFLNVFVCGDIDCENVYETFKNIKFPCTKGYEINLYNIVKNRDKERHLVTTNKGTDSYVNLFYTFDELTNYEEQVVAPVLESILSSLSGRFFQIIREKYSLCYAIGFDFGDLTHTGNISSTTSRDNVKQLEKIVKQIIDDIKNGKIEQKEIDEKVKIICDHIEDDKQYKNSSISYVRDKLYYNYYMPDEMITALKKVTVADVVKLVNKMHFDSDYISKGSKNE
jgi:predicted Zn-dependent peptidase